MQILVDDFNNLLFQKGTIEKGIFPEADPSVELYKVTNNEGVFYAVANGFSEYEVESIPEEVTFDGKWLYTEAEGFYKNPNYQISAEEMLAKIQEVYDNE